MDRTTIFDIFTLNYSKIVAKFDSQPWFKNDRNKNISRILGFLIILNTKALKIVDFDSNQGISTLVDDLIENELHKYLRLEYYMSDDNQDSNKFKPLLSKNGNKRIPTVKTIISYNKVVEELRVSSSQYGYFNPNLTEKVILSTSLRDYLYNDEIITNHEKWSVDNADFYQISRIITRFISDRIDSVDKYSNLINALLKNINSSSWMYDRDKETDLLASSIFLINLHNMIEDFYSIELVKEIIPLALKNNYSLYLLNGSKTTIGDQGQKVLNCLIENLEVKVNDQVNENNRFILNLIFKLFSNVVFDLKFDSKEYGHKYLEVQILNQFRDNRCQLAWKMKIYHKLEELGLNIDTSLHEIEKSEILNCFDFANRIKSINEQSTIQDIDSLIDTKRRIRKM